jgi:3-methyladenine DNA glycosylase/8-oxoguanine DNA glycosylase
MQKLAQSYTQPLLSLDDRPYHLFPNPEELPIDLESPLREMGFGYRAAFLDSSLHSLRTEFKNDISAGLLSWRLESAENVGMKLQGLKGVGRKVADCVMLMSLDQVGRSWDRAHTIAIRHTHRHTRRCDRRTPSCVSCPVEKQNDVKGDLRRDGVVLA